MMFISRFWLSFIVVASIAGYVQAHSGAEHTHGESSPANGLVIDHSLPVVPWTHLQLNNHPDAFQFAVVTDRTGGLRPGVFSQAVDKLNLLQPEFVVSVGDLIEGYTEDRAQLAAEWNAFDNMVERLDMPFFYLAGNHDYTNDVMADVWRERYGKSYYHFVYRDVLFVMLNSNDGGSTHSFSDEQVQWLKQTLQDNPEPKWTLVFTHAPMWDRDEQDRWGEIEAVLDERPFTVFAGHHHRYVKEQRHGRNYFTLATTGGISSMRGTRFGEFDHVVWITMSDDGPIIANLMLDGILDEDVRTAHMRGLQHNMIDRGRLSVPALLHRGDFKQGTAALRLTNDADIPYTLTADILGCSGFAFTGLSPQSITVPPNEVRHIELPVSAVQLAQDNSNALDIRWQLEYDHHGEQVSYSGERTLAISREYPISPLKNLTLDGSLSEWRNAAFFSSLKPHNTDSLVSPADADFSWSLGQSDQHLVIALDVKDDEIVRFESDQHRGQDKLLISLDARPKSRRLLKPTYDNRVPGDRQIILQPPAPGHRAKLIGKPELSDTVWQKVRTTEGGYSAEIAIPFALLNQDHGSRWDGVRINIQMHDVDADGHTNMLQWLPAWGGDEAHAGAGSFYRDPPH
ncbi:metallophosphoesterase [Gilvimarinus sp. 1_MG-2023]|uniref:metallophosphoesterase n=1 Tax=Gilvimarinus sp. 1_MG-2023 TaxID=3062638 RepID=UPI0026E35296|nr:metallophosphoesterase [Gilvimarinus sp. 1_MG-2023]MDO6747946.1 metallophosphoesterase [Gilvimarinus sp. 1_MG-2023]